MLGKSGRKIILYKYIWSFSVYIYTHPPDAGVNLNWQKEKRPETLTRPFFFFKKRKKIIILHYSLRQTKYRKINWIWRLGTIFVKNEAKEQKGGFLRTLLGTWGTSLLGNMLAGKGVIRAGEGTIRARQDF